MTTDDIKRLQLFNQHLTARTDMCSAVRDMLGLQAQFLSNAMHALRIRCDDFSEAEAQALLIKSWTIRGTMHVFLPDDLPLMLHSGREHFLRPCDTMEADERISAERKRHFAKIIVNAVGDGVHDRESLKELCRDAGMTEDEGESVFNAWGGTIRALCENGTLCHLVQGKKTFRLCPSFTPMPKDEAELELARRYFTHYAPATIRDAAYFFGTSQARVKTWLELLPVRSLVCGGRTYFFIGDGTEAPADIPDCVLLGGFDPLLLGYEKAESLYLPPEYRPSIFTRAGIVMPAVLLRGRVAGKWKRAGKALSVTPFERLSGADRERIRRCAVDTWGDIRIVFTEP